MATASVSDDYYSILRVSHFASRDTIKESYKRLALRCHPDKNRDESATRDFQRLIVAWETLRDEGKRKEYDRSYSYTPRSQSDDVNRDATAHWGYEVKLSDEAERRERARLWKVEARRVYMLRLQAWTNFRDGQLTLIRERQGAMRKNERDLEAQRRVPEEEMIRKFQDAIERSRAIGHKIQDHAATLSRLLDARQSYIEKQVTEIEGHRYYLRELMLQMETRRRQYEEEEAISREARVQEALDILGPRDLNPPLFSMIDRRGRAINHWHALLRVKTGVRFFPSLEAAAEGPWHRTGEWERIGGERVCDRCMKAAFHIMLECGPAKCPGCGMTLCHDCHRDLQLLREYDDWIRGPVDDMRDSFFSLEFGATSRPANIWVGDAGFENFAYNFSPAL